MSTNQKNNIKSTRQGQKASTTTDSPKKPKASTTTNQPKTTTIDQPKAKSTTPPPDAAEIKETIQDNYLYTKLSYILFFINLTLLIFSIINIVELVECEKNPSKNCPRPYALEKGAKSQDNINGCYTLLPDQGGKKKRL